MSTATSFQTGTTPNPISANAQDFSGSDDEILDNFADGPQPGDAPPMGRGLTDDTHDDGMPMGLGGEEGKQSEPASSTLEADIAKADTADTKPGEDIPPETTAASEPVQDEGEEVDEEIPSADDEEPTTPEFPPVLLQMAGYPDAEAAKADGFGTPETLHAYIRGRGQLLAPEREGPLYGRSSEKTPPPVGSAPPKEVAEVKPFELPADKLEVLDDDLVDVLKNMNEHYQQEVQSIRSSVSAQADSISQRAAEQQEADEVLQFDQAVQSLGEQWHDTFGTGPGEDLADKAQHDPVAMMNFRNRDELFDEVDDLRSRNAEKGYAPMTLQQEIQFALMQRHPDKFQQTVSGKPERKSRSISRPTQRKTPPKTQNEKSIAAVNRRLSQLGRPKLSKSEHDDFDGEI